MKPVKQGTILYCESCGVELSVIKNCGCVACEIVCCGKPMKIKTETANSSFCCGSN
jgi:hypothetical protein